MYHSLIRFFQSLSSKQRQCQKTGNTLSEHDAHELERVTLEQQGLQKLLEQSRKQTKTHTALINVRILFFLVVRLSCES